MYHLITNLGSLTSRKRSFSGTQKYSNAECTFPGARKLLQKNVG